MESSANRWAYIILIITVLFILIGGLYLYFSGKQKFISPVPPTPGFKVVYYTPTPGEATPTSTPSATPKVKTVTKAPPTKAPVPTGTPSASVTPKATETPTP